MTIALTRKEILALEPCSTKRIPPYRRRKTLTAAEALESGTPIPDLLWVAAKIGRKDLCVRFALACAQRVAYLNTDPRVQAALDAAQAWLDRPSTKTTNAASAATYAAYAAAYATDATDAARAAYAAANTAYTIGYAANAAASYAARAAYAASAAANAAAYAANAAANVATEREAQKMLFLEIFA